MVARAPGMAHLAYTANKADKLFLIGFAKRPLRRAQAENNFRGAAEVSGIMGEPRFCKFQTEAAKGDLSGTEHGNFNFRHPVTDAGDGIYKAPEHSILIGKLNQPGIKVSPVGKVHGPQ